MSAIVLSLSYVTFTIIPGFKRTTPLALDRAAIGFVLLGIGFSGLELAYTGRMMLIPKEELRGSYMTLADVSTGMFMSAGPLIAGWILERLPEKIEIAGTMFLSPRLFFLVIAVLMLSTVQMIKYLYPLRERGLREILRRGAVRSQG